MILKESANNPFRTLGLYLDCTLKQQTANAGKLHAFAMVHKQESMPTDLPELYGKINRSTESLKAAEAQLNNADERLRAALLWWPEPTEGWMTTVMDEIRATSSFQSITGNIPLSALSQPSKQKALLLKLQVCILHEKWEELASTFEQIVKSLDVLKELAHCQATAIDGSSLQQYLYGILEQHNVNIHTVSYTQQIRQLIDTSSEVSRFYDMQLIYYKLERVTEEKKLLEDISWQITNWLVRIMHGNPCPEEEFKKIRQAMQESFCCSSNMTATLEVLQRNIYQPHLHTSDNIFIPKPSYSTSQQKDNDAWITCLFYFVILPLFGIVIRACSSLLFGSSDKDEEETNSSYTITPPTYQPPKPTPPQIDEETLKRIQEISIERAKELKKERKIEWDQEFQLPPPPKIDIPEPIQDPQHKPISPSVPSIDEVTLEHINEKTKELNQE